MSIPFFMLFVIIYCMISFLFSSDCCFKSGRLFYLSTLSYVYLNINNKKYPTSSLTQDTLNFTINLQLKSFQSLKPLIYKALIKCIRHQRNMTCSFYSNSKSSLMLCTVSVNSSRQNLTSFRNISF